MSTVPHPPKGHCCRLSEELEGVLELAGGEPVTLGQIMARLSDRGHALIAFFLALPFLQPLPLVGLSTPLGAVIAVLGAWMALGKAPWLPGRLARRPISASVLEKVARGGQRLLARMERFIKPRGMWFHRHRWARPIAGFMISVSGAELALPLPIIFTNTLPALVIATTAVGMLEEDGLLVGIGGVLFFITLAFFAALAVLPFVGLHALL